MGGVGPGAALDRGIASALRHDRRVVLASLAVLVSLAWLYLWHSAAPMGDMHMESMPHASGASAIALGFVMWAVMMTGMMLPGAAPTVLFYAALVRKGAERDAVYPAVWIFTGGYLAAWAAFSLGAAALQAALEEAMLVTPVIASASSGLSAGVLIAAGVYQWLPLKEVCLSKCRHPLEFFTMRWRAGTLGAFRMGLEHGIYCVGCCWMLMLLLFVAGVMNLLWVAFIAVFVFVEKLAPAQRYVSGAAGITLISTGLLVAALS